MDVGVRDVIVDSLHPSIDSAVSLKIHAAEDATLGLIPRERCRYQRGAVIIRRIVLEPIDGELHVECRGGLPQGCDGRLRRIGRIMNVAIGCRATEIGPDGKRVAPMGRPTNADIGAAVTAGSRQPFHLRRAKAWGFVNDVEGPRDGPLAVEY